MVTIPYNPTPPLPIPEWIERLPVTILFMGSVNTINRFNNPLTQQFLAKNAVSLRAFGAYGSQQALGSVDGTTQYSLASLYNGQNGFLPAINVNGSNNTDAFTRFYTSSGSGISSASSATAVGNPNLSLSFDSRGRAIFGRNTNPSSPAIPQAFADTWIAQRGLSEANLTALLSDPSNTTINLTRLGLTIESDGAGNVVNVRDSLNLAEITPFNSPPNTAEFGLRNPLQFGTGTNITTPGTPSPLPPSDTNRLAGVVTPQASIVAPNKGTAPFSRTAFLGTAIANVGINSDASLQQALLATASQRQTQAQPVDTTLTGPNATVSLQQLQTLQGVNPFANAAQVGTLHQQQLAQVAASQHYAPVATPAERNGIIPLVQPDMPMPRMGPASGSGGAGANQGFGLGAQVDVDAGGQKGAGLMFQLEANLGGGGSNPSSQGQVPGQGLAGGSQSMAGGHRKKTPLSFMA